MWQSRQFQPKSDAAPSLSYSVGPDVGPPLLLLHGVCRQGSDWDPFANALTNRWQVLRLDQRGHGCSGRAKSYKVADYVNDVVRLIVQQIARPTIVVGHSLGAMVAASVAAQVPELVTTIVLEDPPFHTMGQRIIGTSWQAIFQGMQQVRSAADSGTTHEDVAERLAAIEIPVAGTMRRLGELRDTESLKWSATCLLDMDPEVLTPVIAGRWLDDYDMRKVFTQVACPTLLLQADPTSGGALTDFDVQNILGWLRIGSHLKFTQASHQVHRERSQEMLAAIEHFFSTFHGM